MDDTLSPLVSAVQRNCDLSDARYAGCYTMCIYLLKMREYYRWKHGIGFGKRLAMDEVADWVQRTESIWDELDGQDFVTVPVGGTECDVFDDRAINRKLSPQGLVFGSGLGRFGKPVFFLAHGLECREETGFTVYLVGAELARELAAPPAMIRENRIFIRLQSLERTLREIVDEWRWHRRPGAMQRALSGYGFDEDEDLALRRLLADQVKQLIDHEKGEYAAGLRLGDAWNARVLERSGTHGENLMRAVRDWWADCDALLPELLEVGGDEAVHFYFAALTPLRRQLFPTLLRSYASWSRSSVGREELRRQVQGGLRHWQQIADGLLNDTPGESSGDAAEMIDAAAL